MVTHTVSLGVDVFLFVVCIFQILANFIVLYVWILSKRLRRVTMPVHISHVQNDNLILLVSLAFIDFVYAVLQFPYLIILMVGWVPDGGFSRKFFPFHRWQICRKLHPTILCSFLLFTQLSIPRLLTSLNEFPARRGSSYEETLTHTFAVEGIRLK